MHFGHSIYWLSPSQDVLLVISPIDAPMVIGLFVVILFLLFFALVYRARLRYVVAVSLLMCGLLAGASSNGTIRLDPAQNSAEVHTVFFGFPKTYRYPLSLVSGAYVGASDQSSALRLVLNGGAELQLTPFNQMGGKTTAAFTINQFLQQHGGKGSPN